ncbi:MAG: hypothetical protein V4495_08010 [Pseudomonadota bacterium]
MAIVYLSDFSRVFISVILFSALLNKENRPLLEHEGVNSTLNVFVSFLETVHLPFSLFLIYAVAGTSFSAGPVIGAVLLLSMMAARIVLKKMKIIESCNCFGSLAKSDSNRARILDIILFLCSGIIVIFHFFQNGNDSIFKIENANVCIYILILFLSTVISNLESIYTTIKHSEKDQPKSDLLGNKGAPEPISYSGGLIVGKNGKGETVLLSDLAQLSSLIMIVGLSSNCPSCNNAKPIFFRLAEAFNMEMKTIFVFDGERDRSKKLDGLLQIDGATEFFSKLNITNYPFSLVINSQNFNQVGEISYSAHSVWAMFFRLLSVTIKKARI